MRRFLFFTALLSVSTAVWAQRGNSSFDYLLMPQSARSAATGGYNVSIVETDASLIYDNPAFLGAELDKTLLVNYLSYIADIGVGNITFTKKINDKTAFGVGAIYTNYGNMLEINEMGDVLGDLKASDICANFFVAHDLTEKLRGGITGKFMYSNYAHNTAIGLGVDLGLSYYDNESGASLGLVAKNLGRQVKAYEDELASLPWDIQLGYTQKFPHAPLRLSVTANHLKQWKFNDIYSEDDAFMKTAWKHLILGGEILLSDNFWIALGYNVKRGEDMQLEEGSRLNGFSIGFGLRVKQFGIACSAGRYNVGATSLLFSLSTNFAQTAL